MLHPNDYHDKIRKLQDDNAQLQLHIIALKSQVSNLQDIAVTFGDLVPHVADLAVEPPIWTEQGEVRSIHVLHYTIEW